MARTAKTTKTTRSTKTTTVRKTAPVAGRKRTAASSSSAKKPALGKGIGALLATDGIPESKTDSVIELKINDISPNTDQPRKDFDEEKLNELAASIKENGVIQPIIVQRRENGYRIVAGERRWRASRIAGLKVIPAIVRDLTDQETMEQALIENLQREDLNPIEEAIAMQTLIKTHKLTQEQLAKKLGKPRATIANTIRLMNINESLLDFIRSGELSAGHAKAILALKDEEDQRRAADVIMTKDMSVRQAEEYVKRVIWAKENNAEPKEHKTVDPQVALSIKEVETKLKKSLGSRVKIKISDQNTGKGKIVIDYKDNEDLDRLIALMC
ncbi:chromosome partitioning protein, ParB family [Ruminococcaceae bacterium YRB3002]|nr:chromosome partitioning protein, ParB family [Ruminococcaceae bacterium YRB3002]